LTQPPRDEKALRELVEQLGRLLAEWGLPRMAARVIFVLMTADERSLTAGELAERLGVSPAAISGAVRYLTQIHMVARDVVAGSRRDRYRLADDSWYEVTLEKMTLVATLADLARSGVDAAGGQATPAGARLAAMRDFYDFVQAELPAMLGRWAELKAQQAAGSHGTGR
jgi:DNA-binding transcriptional ArsR family regulator